jgi:hypothetical protein
MGGRKETLLSGLLLSGVCRTLGSNPLPKFLSSWAFFDVFLVHWLCPYSKVGRRHCLVSEEQVLLIPDLERVLYCVIPPTEAQEPMATEAYQQSARVRIKDFHKDSLWSLWSPIINFIPIMPIPLTRDPGPVDQSTPRNLCMLILKPRTWQVGSDSMIWIQGDMDHLAWSDKTLAIGWSLRSLSSWERESGS